MVLSGPIPGIDLVGESIAAAISLLITYYAHKAYRLSGQRSLFLLYLGFLLIGVASIAQSIALVILASIPAGTQSNLATLHGIIRLFVGAIIVGYAIHWTLEISGYITIFVAYLNQSRDLDTANTVPSATLALQILPLPLYLARAFSPPLELILSLLLIFILVQVIVIYLPRRHRSTLYVILGFLVLSLAHLAFLLFSFFPTSAETVYALGHILQLTGFLLLLAMILGTTRGK